MLQRILMRVRPNIFAALLKKVLGVKRQVVTTSEGPFFIDPVSLLGVALTQRGQHEPGMIATLHQHLSEGSVFVDLGANEGYFSVIGGRLCGSSGKVLAIEPQRRLLPIIQENLRLNSIQNVQLVNVAISNQAGSATLYLTASTNTGGSGLHNRSKYALPHEEVATFTLEQVLDEAGISKVDLMKVDIEGFEYEALLGSPRVFEQHRIRALALELHPSILAHRGKSASDITSMLESAGYQLLESEGNHVWIAP